MGIEPATCRFVAQCLNHYATARTQPLQCVHKITKVMSYCDATGMVSTPCITRSLHHLKLNGMGVREKLRNLHLLFAGLLARCHYTLPECPAIGHIENNFHWFHSVSKTNDQMVPKSAICDCVPLMQPFLFKFIKINPLYVTNSFSKPFALALANKSQFFFFFSQALNFL